MTGIAPFVTARLPRIVFGSGTVAGLPAEIKRFGGRTLLVTGRGSFRNSDHWPALERGCAEVGVTFETVTVEDEPSPELVDVAVAKYRDRGIDSVVAIGGGSALDAAKAIAGLLPTGRSVMDYLEGVGRGRTYSGPALPFIAVPTTAGTGSEASKNAVLSSRGPKGFKKSFRDDRLVARLAIVDPDLLDGCPASLIAANGMDAFTQLLESFVSKRANPMTEALAWSGMEAFAEGFLTAWKTAGQNDRKAAAARSRIAYGSLMSGITLAQTGLGSVHVLASPLGAFYPVPHGVVCGTLLAPATAINIEALKARDPDSPVLGKYARVGRLLTGEPNLDRDEAQAALVEVLAGWAERLGISRLGTYGMTAEDIPAIAAAAVASGMKTNPILLTEEETAVLLTRRL